MKVRKLLPLLLVLTATSCDRDLTADPSRPDAYAVQVRLEPAAGGGLQRLALPAEALVALRRADLGDIRLFDSRGRVVPVALLDQRAAGARQRSSVPVYPVIGPIGALDQTDLSIRIAGNGAARVVTVGSSPSPARGAAAPAAVILDTRSVREPVEAIVLGADIPAGAAVELTLHSSANLKDWELLAEKMLFRPADGSALLGGATVALRGVDLSDRYVGIGWGATAGVELKRASVITSSVPRLARTAVAAGPVSLGNAHEVRFDLPDLARLAAIRVTGAAADGVVPVKLFGRDRGDRPWTLLSATTLHAGKAAAALEVAGARMTSFRIVADSRTAGFSAPPTLDLLFDPVELVIALSGTPPYRLAAGQPAARANYLTLGEIAPQNVALDLAAMPQARLAPRGGPPIVVALRAGAPDGAIDPRRLMLWGALLLGTLILAFAALRLIRATKLDAGVKQD